MPIKQPRLGDIPVAVATSVPQPDRSADTLIQGLGAIAKEGIEVARANDAAEQLQDNNEFLNAFENTVIEESFSSLTEEAQLAKQQEESDVDLTDDQKRTLGEASRMAASIDAMEDQTGQADNAALRRATIYRQFKAARPELAPELRKFFKQLTGESVVESLKGIEEERSTTAAEARKELHSNLTNVAQGLGYVTAGKTTAELNAIVAPYQDQLVAASQASREAKLLQDNRSIRTEERRQVEESILDSGFKGTLITNQLDISGLLEDFDINLATQEDKTALINELQIRKRAFQTSTSDAFQVTDPSTVTSRMNPILDAYDQAILVVGGELDKKVLTNNNAITRETAMSDLNRVPGYPALLAKLQTFRNIPAELVSGSQRVKYSIDQVQPMLDMLATGLGNPSGNPYGGLAANATPQQLAGQYKKLAEVALADLGTTEAAQNLADTLQAWTNQFTAAPDEVPLAVFDAMLDVSSEAGSMDIIEKSVDLGDNFVNGYRNFTTRMRAGLAEDMAEMQSERIGVFNKGQVSPVKAGFLDFITKDYAESFKRPVEAPALFEVLDVEQKSNGDLIFTPIKNTKVQGNAVISAKAKQMTKAYGQTFGKLVRSYAHVVNGNEDYATASQEMMSFPDWESRMGAVEGTGFKREEEE